MFKTAILETKFGTREITATDAKHVHVSHPGYEHGTAKMMGPIRGIEYHVSAHLFPWSDGTWHIGKYEGYGYNYEVFDGVNESNKQLEARLHGPDQWKARQENASNLYATRAWDGTKGHDDASKSARLAIGAEIERAFNEWVKTPEAIKVLGGAEREHLERELEAAEEEVTKTALAFNEAKQVRAAAKAALAKFIVKAHS